jgi:GntR family phosphonate transport system transcriptional regulator
MTFAQLVNSVAPRHGGEPVWQGIAHTLAGEIRDRVYADGSALPGEVALAERFGVNRHVLRQAIASLQADGLVRVQAGRGTFVCYTRLDYALTLRTRFGDNLRRQGLLPSRQLLTACTEPASATLAEALQMGLGAPVLVVETLDEADGEPVGLARAYYPLPRFEGLLDMLDQGVGHSAMLRAFGIDDYVRVKTQVTAQLPTASVARWLRQTPERPVLCVHSWDADLQGRCIKYGETLFGGDRVQLLFAAD